MSLGGDIDCATRIDNALAQYKTGLDQLIKVFADGAASGLDDAKFISVMQDFEQTRNRIPLVDHSLIGNG